MTSTAGTFSLVPCYKIPYKFKTELRKPNFLRYAQDVILLQLRRMDSEC